MVLSPPILAAALARLNARAATTTVFVPFDVRLNVQVLSL